MVYTREFEDSDASFAVGGRQAGKLAAAGPARRAMAARLFDFCDEILTPYPVCPPKIQNNPERRRRLAPFFNDGEPVPTP